MVKITVGVGGAVCGDQKVCAVKVRRIYRGQPDLISQATLFGGIKGEELEKLLVCMDSTRKKYRRQEMILSEEEIPDRIGIVLEGSVIAEKDCEICWMHIGKVLSVYPAACPCHQQMLRNLVTILAGKNVAFSEKITCLSRRSTREKLLSYLSETAKKEKKRHFVIPFNRQELADYLCVDRSAMSAELSKLRREGVLDYKRSEFWLL